MMIIDSSVWIELFEDTDLGRNASKIISISPAFTSMTSLAEISNWAEKEGRNANQFIDVICKLSTILPLDNEISVLAGQINFSRKQTNQKWGIMDSFVLAIAKTYKQEILTKDRDFGDLQEAKILQ